MRKHPRWTRTSVERLELRTMLAGDVTVQVLNGDVTMIGDAAANNIFIQGTTVIGRNDAAGVATNINGVPNGSFDFSAYTQDLIVQTHGGNDVVEINGVAVPRQLDVQTGDDSDLIQINPAAYTANLRTALSGGNGSDRILVLGQATSLGSNLPLHRTGEFLVDGDAPFFLPGDIGNDEIRVSDLLTNHMVINMGKDADLAEVRFTTVNGVVQIIGWQGYDFISVDTCYMRLGLLDTNTEQGTIHFHNSYVVEDLVIQTAAQSDFVLIEGSRVDGLTRVYTDDPRPVDDLGQEYILIKTSALQIVQVYTGGGSDRLEVDTSVIDQFYAYLGEEPDWLIISHSVFDTAIQADGSDGFDLLTRRGSIFNGFASNNFELFD